MMDDDFEPARRELCSDDSCIGLIGPDGRCRVCGTVAPSAVADPRHRGMRWPRPEEGGEGEELGDDRELCPVDTCVGLIGPDGKCKECGASGRTARPSPDPNGAGRGDDARPDVVGSTTGEDVKDGDEDVENRELCPDGACLGVIGPDGHCKICRTAGASASP